MRKSPKLLALEKNILKYRALQMVLLLHQVESLKSFILGSIRATDKFISNSVKATECYCFERMLCDGAQCILRRNM